MAVATPSSFVRELKEEIAASGLTIKEHPLVQGVYHGTLPKHQLRGWAMQDSHYRRAVPRLATLRYQRGLASNFDVVDAEGSLVLARSALVGLLTSYQVARIELMRVTGDLDVDTEFR